MKFEWDNNKNEKNLRKHKKRNLYIERKFKAQGDEDTDH
jgi:uncharacterized DUF497 family protein